MIRMAHPKLNMEDSDSEYDPSKIPANPPKAMSVRSMSSIPKPDTSAGVTMTKASALSNKPSEALISEAERDWETIDNVCSRPMFAQTEEVERALELLKKWTEGAEARYGAETMAYLKRKVIGPAAEARKSELRRMLSLRKQVNGNKSSSTYTEATALYPPIRPRSEPETQSPIITRPNGIHPRPLSYQPIVERRPELPRAPSLSTSQLRLLAPHPPLPPIQAEPPRNMNQYTSQHSSYPPPPSYPISRGRKWIHSPESDLWCPICRMGPLTCMHSHRLIGRLFTRNIRYSALEELHYVHEQLENWAYRGHPLKMEPAMTRRYSLEELAAEQKNWIGQLRALLNSRPTEQVRDAHLPRPVNSFQQTYPNAPVRHNSNTSTRSFTDSNPHYTPHQPTINGPNPTSSLESPAPTNNSTTSLPRVYDQSQWRRCPGNSFCIHHHDRDVRNLADRQSVDHKRKWSGVSDTRRVKISNRPEVTEIISSDEDVEDEMVGEFPLTDRQKYNQIRTIVNTMPKDQLSTTILRMCYSNSMIMNWMKKELKKIGVQKDIIVTGEGTLITPISPTSITTKTPSLDHGKERKCIKCGSNFDPSKAGECQFHDGELVQDNRLGVQTSRIWQEDTSKIVWTCCGGGKNGKGCRSGKHSVEPIQSTSGSLNGYTVSDLINSTAGRPAIRQFSDSFSTEQESSYPGQSLVKALANAEKETEKIVRDNLAYSPSSRRSSVAGGYHLLQDFAPPITTLHDIPASTFDLGIQAKDPLDLCLDPDQYLLHAQEFKIASALQLTCANYLCAKRRIFRAVVEAMQDGSEFGLKDAQAVCGIEAVKGQVLFSLFEKLGWFEPKYFMKYLNDPSGTMVNSIEKTLPGVNSLPYSGINTSGRPNSAPDLAQSPVMIRRASSGSASVPIIHPHHVDRSRKQISPTQLPHASTLFQPLHSPAHLQAPRFIAGGYHMDHGHNTVNLTDLPHTPPRDLIMAGSPEIYQWRKNGNGKKMQVPICPYPRSWAEADSVDRELVRLKRHEGKQWEELFGWWRGKGRASLKNASCLAVRYSILKKNYESDWVREGL